MPNEGTALAFLEAFATQANGITSFVINRSTKRYLHHFLLEPVVEVKKHIDTQYPQRVNRGIIGKIYFDDFFIKHGNLITIEEALQRVPKEVFALPGSGDVQALHFRDIDEWAREAIQREDAG